MRYLLIGLAIAIAAVLTYAIERSKLAAFREKFPPISDDEFMALCKTGTNREVALKVRKIISHSLGVDYDRIYPSSRFVEDLGCD